ncbi:MAG: hypothetical protein PHO66_02995 [Eubacteriales bacterium]|nr:hypothetical protein [Eubacteriales bacterium]
MRSALSVYLGIFILLLIPLVCLLVGGILAKRRPRKLRLRNIVLGAAGIAALTALCLSLYFITINRQPRLVIHRVFAGIQAGDVSVLVEKRLLTTACSQQDLPGVTADIAQAKTFGIGQKTLSAGGNTVYVVVPDQAVDRALLVEVYEAPGQSTVVSLHLVEGDEAGELIAKDTFPAFH